MINQNNQGMMEKPKNLIIETQGITSTINKQVEELNEIIANLNQSILGSARPLMSEGENSKKMSLGYIQDHLVDLREISKKLSETINQTQELKELFLENK